MTRFERLDACTRLIFRLSFILTSVKFIGTYAVQSISTFNDYLSQLMACFEVVHSSVMYSNCVIMSCHSFLTSYVPFTRYVCCCLPLSHVVVQLVVANHVLIDTTLYRQSYICLDIDSILRNSSQQLSAMSPCVWGIKIFTFFFTQRAIICESECNNLLLYCLHSYLSLLASVIVTRLLQSNNVCMFIVKVLNYLKAENARVS